MPASTSYGLNADMEQQVVRELIANPLVLPRIARHLRVDGFKDDVVRLAVQAALAYHRKAKGAPTAVALLQEVREQVNEGKLEQRRVVDVATMIDDATERPPVDGEWVVSKILDVERDRALWDAIERSTKLYQQGRKDDIFAEVQRADAIGRVDSTPGIDYGGTLAERTERRLLYKAPKRWGTGIVELDDLLDGGVSKDNPLGMVLAPPKGGKSLFLIAVAINHLALGGYAVYFSFENGEGETTDRVDAAISGVPIKYVYARALEVKEKVAAFATARRGGMHIKKFPGGRKTACRDVDVYLEQLRIERSIRPTCVIFDYVDEMAADDPSRYDKRHEELEAICGEQRAVLEKHGCVGWTASRVKQEALEKKSMDVGDVAGAFAKANVVDCLVGIYRSKEEKLDGRARFGVIASRFCQDGTETAALPSAPDLGQIVVRSNESYA